MLLRSFRAFCESEIERTFERWSNAMIDPIKAVAAALSAAVRSDGFFYPTTLGVLCPTVMGVVVFVPSPFFIFSDLLKKNCRRATARILTSKFFSHPNPALCLDSMFLVRLCFANSLVLRIY